MRVMVTGGTGFVGLNTVLALLEAGHEVQLLVRSLAKLRRIYGPLGLADIPYVEGDITDPGSVEEALEGCDAVVHAAAMVSIRAVDSERVNRVNVRGAELVLGGAVRRGIDRMVQVSSTTALFRPGKQRITERSVLGTTPTGYGHSKIEADRIVRQLQAEGKPIYTSYPGSVMGPNDPGLSEAMAGLKGYLDTRCVFETTGGIQIIDARDLGRAHVLMLERGGPPDRFVLGGQYLEWPAYGDLLEEVTGERFLRVPTPAIAMRALGWLGDQLNRIVPFEAPLTSEGMAYATEWARSDDRHAQEVLGLEYRDLRETLRDAIRWLAERRQLWWNYDLPEARAQARPDGAS